MMGFLVGFVMGLFLGAGLLLTWAVHGALVVSAAKLALTVYRLRALLLQVVVHIEGQVSADPSDAALAARLKAALEE